VKSCGSPPGHPDNRKLLIKACAKPETVVAMLVSIISVGFFIVFQLCLHQCAAVPHHSVSAESEEIGQIIFGTELLNLTGNQSKPFPATTRQLRLAGVLCQPSSGEAEWPGDHERLGQALDQREVDKVHPGL